MSDHVRRKDALAAGALAAATLSTPGGRPRSSPPKPRLMLHWIQEFGMISLARGQSLRLNVVHLNQAPPSHSGSHSRVPNPPSPADVILGFYDAQGAQLGAPTSLTLSPGASTYRELSFESGASASGPYRASVLISQPGLPEPAHFNPCVSTLELRQSGDGGTVLHVHPAIERALPPSA
ncbi:MAG TPA: hypothetical protein VEN81_08825 [Planctomycetota bacterium]|nr:hypothetical protein [Planctomycetota bacterium]